MNNQRTPQFYLQLTAILLLLLFVSTPKHISAFDKGKNLTYSWQCTDSRGTTHSLSITLNFPSTAAMKQTYRQIDHSYNGKQDYVYKYIRNDPYRNLHGFVAQQIFDVAYANNICPATVAITFVQQLKYHDAGERYVRYPMETLIDRAGVCSEKSALLAVLLFHLGYKTVLLIQDSPNHCAVGVAENNRCYYKFSGESVTYKSRKYYYVETTSSRKLGSAYWKDPAWIVEVN